MSNRQSRFKWKAGWPSSSQQHDACMHPTHWPLSKKGANAGSRTGDRMLKRMGCNPYANCLAWALSCVFKSVVILAFREKLPSFLRTKPTIETNQLCHVDLPNRPFNFKQLAFDVNSSFLVQIWLGIKAKTLTFPKQCHTSTNSRDHAR